jgi:hypothetical protein
LHIKTEKKIYLRQGAGSEADLAYHNGRVFHDPAQTGHKQDGKGKKTDQALFFHVGNIRSAAFCVNRILGVKHGVRRRLMNRNKRGAKIIADWIFP